MCDVSSSDLLALAALVVSLASVYLTSLRRPRLELEHVQEPNELEPQGWDGPTRPRVTLRLVIFIGNTGSSGGVISRLEPTAFRCHDSPLFKGIDHRHISTHTLAGHAFHIPRAFERDDTGTTRLSIPLVLAPELHDSRATLELFAEHLHRFRSVSLTVECEYRRPRLLRRSKKQSKVARCDITVDGAEFREHVLADWRTKPKRARFVAIAEGRTPPESDGSPSPSPAE